MKVNTKKKIAGKYIFSGLFKTAVQMISGLIILRWIEPEKLGLWQSFTVIVSYASIMNLGVTSGINRELPFWLGKNDEQRGVELLQTAGSFTWFLGLALNVLGISIALILYALNVISFQEAAFLVLAIFLTSVTMQGNLLGATFRSSASFNKLANIQLVLSVLYVVLIPMIYWYSIWGYVFYVIIIALLTYTLYMFYRPFKVKYRLSLKDLKYLVNVGFPIFFWTYVNNRIQSFPRLILVFFGSPYLVGLFSPAASIKQVMLNLPKYTNRYLFPQMSYRYGQTDDSQNVIKYAFKAAFYLFLVTLLCGLVMCVLLTYVMPMFFSKYVDGTLAAQITVFTGVIYGTNLIFQNALNALKNFKVFKFIIGVKFVSILLGTYIAYLVYSSILEAVAFGALFAELFSTIFYIYYLKKS